MGELDQGTSPLVTDDAAAAGQPRCLSLPPLSFPAHLSSYSLFLTSFRVQRTEKKKRERELIRKKNEKESRGETECET